MFGSDAEVGGRVVLGEGFLLGFLVGGDFGGFEIFAGLNWKVNCQVAILKY